MRTRDPRYDDVLKRDGKWYYRDTELVCPVLVANETTEILGDLAICDRVTQRFDLPPARYFVSSVTALVYLSWCDLYTVAADFQDPHPAQYEGTWSEVSREELLEELNAAWRPDIRRRPGAIAIGLAPGWGCWSKGRPKTWRELNAVASGSSS